MDHVPFFLVSLSLPLTVLTAPTPARVPAQGLAWDSVTVAGATA
jgi:hypothetical protein